MSAWDGSSTEYSCQSTSNCVSDNTSSNNSNYSSNSNYSLCEGVRSSTVVVLEFPPHSVRTSHQVHSSAFTRVVWIGDSV